MDGKEPENLLLEAEAMRAMMQEIAEIAQAAAIYPLSSRGYRPRENELECCDECKWIDPYNNGDPVCVRGVPTVMFGCLFSDSGMQEIDADHVCDEFKEPGTETPPPTGTGGD